jgi:predicted aldo/keto reductase-like oxidoreductase
MLHCTYEHTYQNACEWIFATGVWPGHVADGWKMGSRCISQDEKEIHAIQHAIEQGITHLDTAESYGNGHSEEFIATATRWITIAQSSLLPQKYQAITKATMICYVRARLALQG